MLSDQQPITRCFVLLCLCTAAGVLVFEWSDPLALKKETVVVTSLAPLSVIATDPAVDKVSAKAAAVVETAVSVETGVSVEATKQQPADRSVAGQAGLAEKIPGRSQPPTTAIPSEKRGFSPSTGRRPVVVQKVVPEPSAAVSELPEIEVRVKLAVRQVELYKDGELIEQYPVAIGQDDWQTPAGTFEVLQMQQQPAWQHPITQEVIEPGPDNPLGTHWIGFWTDGTSQIGFHGTNQEELIGQAVSHGCIRMRNQDIQKLYGYLALGTRVVVES